MFSRVGRAKPADLMPTLCSEGSSQRPLGTSPSISSESRRSVADSPPRTSQGSGPQTYGSAMNAFESYYEESLYPLQDGVLKRLATAFAPISDRAPFLTGGTALGRRYFGHRYSDDLDLFFSRSPSYVTSVDIALQAVADTGLNLVPGTLRRLDSFTRFVIASEEVRLQIDLVNDSAARVGELVEWDRYPWVDSIENILTNKITALYRLEPKDLVDLREIAINRPFSWADMLREAERKEAGIDAPRVADLITTFPKHLFDTIKWRRRPDPSRFFSDLDRMADDILTVGINSLRPNA